VLLVPDLGGRSRGPLLRSLAGRLAVAGPSRPWLEVRASFTRALRALPLRSGNESVDTERHLPALVLEADPAALEDLRRQVLAPLADLRPAAADKLTTTLRAWLLHQGRREDVAEALFVHPQTVRYRLGQLRELYGDRLEDPDTVLALTLALGSRT
jgi:DNA-binding PucR family transcriptional regulator